VGGWIRNTRNGADVWGGLMVCDVRVCVCRGVGTDVLCKDMSSMVVRGWGGVCEWSEMCR